MLKSTVNAMKQDVNQPKFNNKNNENTGVGFGSLLLTFNEF